MVLGAQFCHCGMLKWCTIGFYMYIQKLIVQYQGYRYSHLIALSGEVICNNSLA